MSKRRKTAVELSEESQSRTHKCSPIFSREGKQSISNFPLISIFFIVSKAVRFVHEIFVELIVELGSPGASYRSVYLMSIPHSVWIICTWTLVSTPFHRTLIHSFIPFPLVSLLNLYPAAYLARFLPVIDAHSIRLRTPVDLSRTLFLSLITSLGVVPKKKGGEREEGGNERYARRLVSFHSGRRTN